MSKKLIVTMAILSFTLFSCNNDNQHNFVTLEDYSDVYASIDYETQIDIENAYKQKFDNEIKWCMPNDNVNGFKSKNDLALYCESNTGFRVYGNFDDTYVLCLYELQLPACNNKLMYQENDLLGDSSNNFGIQYTSTYLFFNKRLYRCDETIIDPKNSVFITDLHNFIDLSEKEVMSIKECDDKYNQKYLMKFKSELDNSLNDAYKRLINSLPDTSSSSNIDDSISVPIK